MANLSPYDYHYGVEADQYTFYRRAKIQMGTRKGVAISYSPSKAS